MNNVSDQTNTLRDVSKSSFEPVVLFAIIFWPLVGSLSFLGLDSFFNMLIPQDGRPFSSLFMLVFVVLIHTGTGLFSFWIVTLLFLTLYKRSQAARSKAKFVITYWVMACVTILSLVFLQALGGLSYIGCGDTCTHVYIPGSAYATTSYILIATLLLSVIWVAAYMGRLRIRHKS